MTAYRRWITFDIFELGNRVAVEMYVENNDHGIFREAYITSRWPL